MRDDQCKSSRPDKKHRGRICDYVARKHQRVALRDWTSCSARHAPRVLRRHLIADVLSPVGARHIEKQCGVLPLRGAGTESREAHPAIRLLYVVDPYMSQAVGDSRDDDKVTNPIALDGRYVDDR